jgi:ABC-type glycerol-3-phosphate transport system substrate-binding protein
MSDRIDQAIADALDKPLTRRKVLMASAAGMLGAGVSAFLAACGVSPGSSPQSSVPAATTAGATGTPAQTVTPTLAPTQAPSQATPVAITWFVPPIFQYQFDGKTLQTDPGQWPLQAAEAFTKTHPNITVKPEVIPWDVWPQRRTASLTQGPAPDLMYRLSPDVVNSGLVEEVDALYKPEDESDLLAPAIAAMTREGHRYGVPWIGNPALLIFNRSMVEKAGALDLLPDGDTPRDLFWPQYIELMKKVKGSSTDTYGVGFAAGHWSAIIGWALGGWLKLWGAKTWSDDTESKYVLHEDDNTYKALDTYVQLVKDGLLVPGTPKWEDLDQLWYRQQLLSRGHWAAVDTELDAAVKAGTAAAKFDLVYTQFPRADGADPGVDHNNDGNVFPMANAGGRQAAFDFGMWLARDSKAAVGIAGNGFFPIGKAGAAIASKEIMSSKPQYQWVLNQALNVPAIPKSVSGPVNNPHTVEQWAKIQADNLYYATWESIVTLQRPPREAMKELGDRINRGIGAA